MKHYYLAILVLLFLFSCKKTNEAPEATFYPEKAVGAVNKGVYIVQDSIALGLEWAKALSKSGENHHLENFKIVTVTTQGEVKKQCFLLTASANNGKVKAAALLLKKANSFYFDINNPASVVCTGDCVNGCPPQAIANAQGILRLVCSSCATCSKTDAMLNF